MTAVRTATLPRLSRTSSTDRVLVVTEDPDLIAQVRAIAEAEGARVIACLGPAASPCFLDDKGLCPLAATCRVVIVESPAQGSFKYHLTDIPAGAYAERLQRAHPETYVVLIPAVGALAGPTGEVAAVASREESLHLLSWILRAAAVSNGTSERRTG